jgi:hypothetical protein
MSSLEADPTFGGDLVAISATSHPGVHVISVSGELDARVAGPPGVPAEV